LASNKKNDWFLQRSKKRNKRLIMNYDYLKTEKSPQILVQSRALIGTKEIVGKIHSETILGWAKELKIDKIYTNDEIAWCGLFIAYVAKKAGLEINMTAREALWALNWNKFGTRETVAKLGDVLTFRRNTGGHVGIYVGEDATCYHILGGNQSNMVNITRIEKTRLSQIRRTDWKVAQPANVRQIFVNANGFISKNES
jgi:uncharacterized protein (TIGR02594 family)